MTDHPAPLQRDVEAAALRAVVDAATAGHGGVAVVAGEAGAGKTTLLDLLAATAPGTARVARARGDELEQGFGFGTALDLLRPLVDDLDPVPEDAVLGLRLVTDGPTALPAPAPGTDPAFAVVHALHRLVVALAGRDPLVLLVDDAHWVDEGTRSFLTYLAGRLGDLRVALVVAVRDAGGDHPYVAELEARAATTLVHPATLAPDTVATLVGRHLPGAPPGVAAACHRATGGNPFYVTALLEELRARGADADLTDDDLADVDPPGLRRALLRRLDQATPEQRALVHAAAVLGDDAALEVVGALAGVPVDTVVDTAQGLVTTGLLASIEPLRFRHPIVRESLYRGLGEGDATTLHLNAARLLDERRAPARTIAPHLHRAPRLRTARAVAVLREAAEEAASVGQVAEALSHLDRAVEEGGAPADEVAPLLLERASLRLIRGGGGAVDDLRAALAATTDPALRARLHERLGHALFMGPDPSEAVAEFQRGIAEVPADRPDLAAMLESGLFMTAHTLRPFRHLAIERIDRLRTQLAGPPAGPADRALMGTLAMELLLQGRDPDAATSLARRALGPHGEMLAEVTADSGPLYSAIAVLAFLDHVDEADAHYRAAQADAARRDSAIGAQFAASFRSLLAARRGRLGLAIDLASAAPGALGVVIDMLRPVPSSALGTALLWKGDVAGALAEVEAASGGLGAESSQYHPLLHLRAECKLVEGDAEGALEDFRLLGRLQDDWSVDSPLIVMWRPGAACALGRLGRFGEAAALADEELARCRPLGVARPLGIALRARAHATADHAEQRHWLEEAVAVLDASPAELELVRALLDLGTLVRRTGHPTDARPLLRRAWTLAGRLGADALHRRAGDELRAAGGRRRSGSAAATSAGLTVQELRVAELAADGLLNPAIADALTISRRTVETHLTSAYRKLGIPGRAALADALGRTAP